MGAHMARRIAQAGHKIAAWNRTPAKAEALSAFGVAQASDATAAARGADAVICMLSSGPVCDETLVGGGVLGAMRPGSLLIVMSSIPSRQRSVKRNWRPKRGSTISMRPSPGARRVHGKGLWPSWPAVPRMPSSARAPSCEVMGRPTRIGPAGTGQLSKLVNQMIVASTIVTVAEAVLLAERGGADPAKVREALLGGFADSTILRQHALRMIERNFQPGGPAKYQVKDTTTAVEFGRTIGLELPVLQVVDRLFGDMVEHGDGDLDHSAIIREIGRRNGLSIV